MNQDPFGNLMDWGRALDMLEELADNGKLEGCQSGLVRILRFMGNWRLREDVLKRVGSIQTPCDELIFQVLNILADDNIYYEARILATEALIQMLKNVQEGFAENISIPARKVTEKLRMTPQPIAFDNAIAKLCSNIGLLGT